jgi:hypothetical protein
MLRLNFEQGVAMRAARLRTRRAVAVIALWAPLAMALPGAAHASTWANEQAMVDSTSFRGTFVADPGRGSLWDRAALIQQHGGYYRGRGMGNVLTWAPRVTHDPGAGANWAGCGALAGHEDGLCPDGQPLHLREIGFALADTRITAFAWDGAFIALACGNFSERRSSGPIPAIAGKKFEDVDGDGTRDPGEPGLAGWRIELYQHGSLLTTTTTDSGGDYRIALDANALAIDSESFELREVQQAGWVASRTPGEVQVPFGSGDAVFGANDFGNYRPARVGGAKYEDMDADGDRDSDDPGLEGWTIALGGGPSAPRSTVTGASGAYALSGLRPGTYAVAEQLQPGWRYSAPSNGVHTITLRSGDAATADFGNYRPATIAGMKFDDHDVDRERDANDGGLAGWAIALTGGRSPDAGDVTDDDGRYAFGGLIPGRYVVGEMQRAGWRQSAPASGTHAVTVRSGDIATADFGNVCLGTSRVAIAREDTGQPLEGVEVRIEEIAVGGVLANEPPLPRTTTGPPTFADLLPGTYRVVAFLPDRVYTTDADLTLVDGRLAVVKRIEVRECATTAVPIRMFASSTGKVTGGMRMDVPGGFATAGFVFMTRKDEAEGSLEYQDHATGLNLHTKRIEQIYVIGNEAWIGGLVDVGATTYRFSLHLVDNGEPGDDDRFELLVASGYRAGYDQTIDGGNVQIHKPARG